MLQFLKSWFGHLKRKEWLVIGRSNVVEGPEGPIMRQLTLIGILGWNLRLHFFYRGDGEDFHSHPRGFVSLCLLGEYHERLEDCKTVRIVRPGTLTIRKATATHNVTPIKFPCVTLVIATPILRMWEKFRGFCA